MFSHLRVILAQLGLLDLRGQLEALERKDQLVRLGLLAQLARKDQLGLLGLRARTAQMAQLALLVLPEQPPDLELQLLRLAR